MRNLIYKLRTIIPDKIYIKLLYLKTTKLRLNLKAPKRYNEKLQWLKLYDRNTEYSSYVDKYAVREIIKEKIGEKYLIKNYGVYNAFEEIPFNDLPNSFVIKCTHDSGSTIIVKDKSVFNFKEARKKINKYLKKNYFFIGREFPYKNVEPRIIVDEYIEEVSGLNDYKFFCFDGEPKIMYVASERGIKNVEVKFDFFDMNFNKLNIRNGHPNSSYVINKPKTFNNMIDIARILSKGFKHVRIDLYEIKGQIYFGEYTFYHVSGYVRFYPDEWDFKLGKMINLQIKD